MPFLHEIAAQAAKALNVTPDEVLSLIGKPPREEMGDYALPCFPFAKTMRRSPRDIARMITEGELPRGIVKMEEAGGYANFFVDRTAYAATVLGEAEKMGKDYGKVDLGKGAAVCIDYSSINIAKPFHIGHLSSTAIGHALYNLYNFMGYKSVGINHLGDWGTQFGKLITAYKMWSSEEEVLKGGVSHMLELYVRYHAEAEKDPSLDDTARAWFVKIEQGDEEALSIFTLFKDMTLKE
ncbi:MAG: arginine--tRNA ligase, partial [Clostridiales bacterium]|nr:arginine--tRNA ligase [Clostridiales bacterium]